MTAKWVSGYDRNSIVAKLEKARSGTSFEGGAFIDLSNAIESIIEFDEQILPLRKSRITHGAIMSAARRGKLTSKAILTEVNRMESEFTDNSLTDYVLLTTLSVPYDSALRRRSVNGMNVTFSPHMPSGYRWSQHVESMFSRYFASEMLDMFTFVRVITRGRDPEEAANSAFNSLDLMRSVWNFGLGYGKMAIFSNVSASPINQVLSGPFHTLHYPRGKPVKDHFWYDKTFPRLTHTPPLDLGKVEKAEKTLRGWRNLHPYRAEIERVLIRYCRALDQVDLETAYLKLWGVLETLTNSNRADEIGARVAFIHDDYHLAKQTVKYLRSYRNVSVHTGNLLPEMEMLVLRLKRMVEAMLLFHLSERLGFNSMSEVADKVLALPPDSDRLRDEIRARRFAIGYRES